MSGTKTILTEANDIIHGERAKMYGPVSTNFENIAKGWSVILGTEVTAKQVGLCMVWLKISRELNAPNRDNLVDGAGYFGTIEKLEKGE